MAPLATVLPCRKTICALAHTTRKGKGRLATAFLCCLDVQSRAGTKQARPRAAALRFQFQLRADFSTFMRVAVDIDVKVAVLEALVLLVGKLRTGRNRPFAR